MKLAVCPNCGRVLDAIYKARDVKLEWIGDKWIEADVLSDENSCIHCYAGIDDVELEEMGRPLGKEEW
jgi:hypothetical protein